MEQSWQAWQLLKCVCQHDRELEPKQSLCARQDHPSFCQHLLDPGMQRCGLCRAAIRCCLVAFGGALVALHNPAQSIPCCYPHQREAGSCDNRENSILYDADQRDCEVDPKRDGERREARCGAKRRDDQRSSSAFPSIRNALEGRWCDQQPDTAQHKQQSNGIGDHSRRRQGVEPRLEGTVKLEAEQDLGAEHQRARFVKGGLHLATERHGQSGSALLRLLAQQLGDRR